MRYTASLICHKSPTGHMNPAVSLALCLNGRITVLRALMYIGAQIVGGIVGSALARALRYTYISIYGDGVVMMIHPPPTIMNHRHVALFCICRAAICSYTY